MIPGLGAQRLMGPKVVRFAGEKSLSLLRSVILLRSKPLIGRSMKSSDSELGHGAVEEIFLKAPHRNPLVKTYEARQEPKTAKIMFKVEFTRK